MQRNNSELEASSCLRVVLAGFLFKPAYFVLLLSMLTILLLAQYHTSLIEKKDVNTGLQT